MLHTRGIFLIQYIFAPQGIDVKSMGRIFIGLVKCGAWGCFDEFNRLEEAVLSAVSMQIQVIQDAIKNRAASIELLGRTVSMTYSGTGALLQRAYFLCTKSIDSNHSLLLTC